ncbi:fructose-bisphosphate aldolase [Gimesia maris DSM 8797]|nr:fructose-bisphosphate aldolase [Gimesia maris DSM 8797]
MFITDWQQQGTGKDDRENGL